jgi:hypothetical protein
MTDTLRNHFVKYGGIYILAFLLSISCASPQPTGPGFWLLSAPSSPEEYCFVKISSIPEGADIYEMYPDATLGEKLGTTPMTLRVGFAWRRYSHGVYHSMTMWGPGCCWDGTGIGARVRLSFAAVKQGYATEFFTKTILPYRVGEFPSGTTVTIPLRAISGGDAPSAGQQQQQQQQTVVLDGANQTSNASRGTVMVTSSIEGSEVFVDGLLVGNSPVSLPLEAGIHVIEVKKDGYTTYKRELRVLAGGSTTLVADLAKSP